MRRAEALDALLEAANEQGGYVSGLQAKRLGVGRKDIDRLVAAGDLQWVRRGVYRMRHAQSRFEDEVAAWLHLQRDLLPWERRDEPHAVLSHESAAGFQRLGTIIPGRPTYRPAWAKDHRGRRPRVAPHAAVRSRLDVGA